jgi:hypothetical protein
MVRRSGPACMCSFASFSMRSASCGGTPSIMSTSPEMRADTRVDGLGITKNVALSTLPVFLSHQPGVRCEDRLHARIPFLDDVGTGAHGIAVGKRLGGVVGGARLYGVVRFGPFLVHDVPVGDLVRQDRVDGAGLDADLVVVDLFGRNDRIEVCLDAAGLAAGQREDDIIGGKGVPVRKFHVLAEIEFPGRTVRLLPFGCQRRFDLLLGVTAHKRFVDIGKNGEDQRVRNRMGIKRIGIERAGELEIRRLGHASKRSGDHGCSDGAQQHLAFECRKRERHHDLLSAPRDSRNTGQRCGRYFMVKISRRS